MKRYNGMKLLALVCGIMVLFAFSSCHDGNDDDNVTEETVIFFFPYSGLESQIDNNINDIKKAVEDIGGLGDKRLVVIKSVGRAKVNIFELVWNGNECTESIVSEGFNTDFSSYDEEGSTTCLSQLLGIARCNAPADSYSLIVGSHGSAWLPAGISLSDISSKHAPRINKAFGTAGVDGQISNESLANAVKKAGMHFGYIFFDACLMANVETIYEYRDVCDFFIGSASETMAYGAPYRVVLKDLLMHDYAGFAGHYVSFYENSNTPYATISVVRTSFLNDLSTVVRELNNMTQMGDDDEGSKAVQCYDGMEPHLFYDFLDWVEYKGEGCDYIVEEIRTLVSKMIVASKHTPTIYSSLPKTQKIPLDKYCGFSTSCPTQNALVSGMHERTAWYADTK